MAGKNDTKLRAVKDNLDADQEEMPVEMTSIAALQRALSADDRPIERVVVPEWPNHPVFYLRGLTGHDRDTIENTTFGDGVNDISAKIVARCLVDQDGTRLATKPDEVRQIEKLLTTRTAGGLLRLQRVAKRLSRLDPAAVEEMEALLQDPTPASK